MNKSYIDNIWRAIPPKSCKFGLIVFEEANYAVQHKYEYNPPTPCPHTIECKERGYYYTSLFFYGQL